MKTRKLLAMLVAVAMIVTMLPVVAFAEEDLKGTIARDPGNTGGQRCEAQVNENRDTITFTGTIDYYL
ncbi:MAG: hypothetical protein WAQ41_00625, partial [bacterium]